MASNKKVITLGLDYSQFDGGITECNRKMKLLDSEFRSASEQTKLYGDETDQLTLKQKQLTEKINLQTQKVNLSKEAYTKALESGKATDKQLDNLKIAYNNNEAALAKLNNELAENGNAIANSNEKAQTFGDSIRNMASSLGLEVSPALEAVASKFDGISKEVGNAVLGIGAIVATFASCTFGAAEMADELLELSSVTGITTDQLQKMQYASDFLDVDVESMTGSITKLTRNMNSARDGAKEQAEAFAKLHVKYKEVNGELLNAEDVFYSTIDALGKVTNETERDALAMTLLGKSAKDLNPLIEAGSEKLRELGIEAEDMGVIMGGESLDKLGKMKDAMDKFDNTTTALKNSLGLVLLPILTALFTAISAIPAPVLQTLVVLASVIVTVLLVVKAIKSVTDTVSTIKNFSDVVSGKAMKITLIILGVVAAIIALVVAISVLSGKGKDLQNSMSSVGQVMSDVTSSVTNAQSNTVSAVGHANGTKFFEGGTTWINEAGPELVTLPRGTRIDSNSDTKQILGSGGDTYNITIEARNVKEFNDVVSIMQNLKQTARKGVRKNV
jgi:hypothetical protein